MLSKQNSDLINSAIAFACKAHKGQFRKGTDTPYISHPFGVGMLLAKFNYPDELIAAGLLHDCVEDTSVTLGQIEAEFGAKIAEIVKGCSEPNKGAAWEDRKKHTIEYLKTAPMDIKIVSCADKLQNVQSIIVDHGKYGEALWERFNAGKERQIWYYSSLVGSFGRGSPIFELYEETVMSFK